MNLRLPLLAFAFALCAIAVAACNSNPNFGYSPPPPGPTCSPGETVQMVYPIPGATAVPDNPQQFVFALATPLPSSWNVYLNNTKSLRTGTFTIAGMQTISASQVPSPAASPTVANPTYQSVTLTSGFNSGETIYVWLNNSATNCTPLGPLGSFTTK